VAPETVIARSQQELASEDFQLRLNELGIDCEAATRLIDRIWHRPGEAIARLRLGRELAGKDWRPEVLDAVTVITAAAGLSDQSTLRVLSKITNVEISGVPAPTSWVHAVVHGTGEETRGEIHVRDDEGKELLHIEGLHLAPAPVPEVDRDINSLFYDIDWREATLPPPAAATDGTDHEALTHEFERLASKEGLHEYADLMAPLESLATEYARAALARLGVFDADGRPAANRIERARTVVADRHERLFNRLVGWFDCQEKLPRPEEAATLLRNHKNLEQRFRNFGAEVGLLGRCGPHLAEALRGDLDPLDLLFGDPALLTRLYEESPFAKTFNAFVASLLADAQRHLSGTETMRVLEVGAGTGGTTSAVLPRLNRHRTEYVFTDLSPAFLARARSRYHDYPFVSYQLFDVERGPSQKMEPHSFHVILAANVLHAAADVRTALVHLTELIAPGGWLVLVEGTRPQRWVDLTFGLTDGWWRFADPDVRRDYPLLPAADWRARLHDLGFADVDVFPDSNGSGSVGQVVIRAKTRDEALACANAPRHWIVVSGDTKLSAGIVERVEQLGDVALRIEPSAEPGLIAASLGACENRANTRVLVVADETEPHDPVEAASAQCAGLCEVLRTMQNTRPIGPPSVWVVTRGAQAVGRAAAARLDHAALWGLGQAAALEVPETWGGLIDLDPAVAASDQVDLIIREVLEESFEDRVAYREGQRYLPRLVPRVPVPTQTVELGGPDISWLITGGFGALGLRVADWLARKGVRHLVLLGRSDLSAQPISGDDSESRRRHQALERLKDFGVQVERVVADVSDPASIARVVARFGATWPRLQGIVHTAATFGARSLLEMTAVDLADMFRPKAGGAWQLHLHAPATLEHLVLFSSTASLLGGMNQAHYAAANAMLDALAYTRRSAGLPALSINWGLWEDMRHTTEDARRHYAAIGLQRIASDRALEAMSVALANEHPQSSVASIDWTLLKNAYQVRRQRPFLSDVGLKAKARSEPVLTDRLAERILAADERARIPIAMERVRKHAAEILEIPDAHVMSPDQGLFELGMDSLMSVELKNRLEREIGQPLPSTLTFNYPSVRALAGYLVDTLAPSVAVTGDAPHDLARSEMSEDELASLLSAHLERSSS
jgi:NAD(P)-dependent dehydrogenase (short-subunit alcohol dehydrogenase family)/SAM-dependent methyltransferase/acyl carrier protein